MTESALLAMLKSIGLVTIGPILALFGWLGKRLHSRLDAVENENRALRLLLAELDKEHAVQAAQLLDIKTDIANINIKLDKIIDKLSSR